MNNRRGADLPTEQSVHGGRVEWIDATRGLAMVLIVLGHVAPPGSLQTWVFSFHVPLFFFLSGLLFAPRRGWLRKRLKQLMVPYYVVGAVSVLAYEVRDWLFGGERLGGANSVMRNLWGLLYGNGKNGWMEFNAPLWFLPALMCVCVLGALVHRMLVTTSPRRIWASTLVTMVASASVAWLYDARLHGPALPWELETAVAMLPFFLAGMAVRLLRQRRLSFEPTVRGVAVGVAFLVVGGWVALINGRSGRVDYPTGVFGFLPAFYGAAVVEGMGSVMLSAAVARGRIGSVLCVVGRRTMSIVLWHKFPLVIMGVLLGVMSVATSSVVGIALTVAETAIAIAVCLLIDWAMPARWCRLFGARGRTTRAD